jgi:hypothetical protein
MFFFQVRYKFFCYIIVFHGVCFRFIYVDIGKNGRISDGGVWRETDLAQSLDAGTAHIPDDAPYPHDDAPMPYYFVADEAFPLKEYIMKPYPQRRLNDDMRRFNYRLSRARRCVENAFGILANR